MPPLTGKLHTFRYLDGAAGFRHGRAYPLRHQVFDSGEVSVEMSHVVYPDGQPRLDLEPLVLSSQALREWFEPVA